MRSTTKPVAESTETVEPPAKRIKLEDISVTQEEVSKLKTPRLVQFAFKTSKKSSSFRLKEPESIFQKFIFF